MKATKRIKKLLKDLQAFADGDPYAPEGLQSQGTPQEVPAEEDAALSQFDDGAGSDLVSEKSSPVGFSTSSTTATSTGTGANVSNESGKPHVSDLYPTEVFRDEVERLVQQLGDSRILVATLMAEINILHQEKAQKDSQTSLCMKRLEEEITQLQQQAHKEMALLKVRQDQIEMEAPILEEQLKSLKSVLLDFHVPQNLYAELVALPEGKRSVKAHLQILAYEKTKNFKDEMEAVRKERDTSREALTRENAEVEKLQREIQRMQADAALAKRDTEKEMGSVTSRNERLAAELQEALVNVEVLSAKGTMYDEVKEKLEKSEQNAVDSENQKAVMAATLQVVTDEKQRLLEVVKDKDHCLDLLSMDKIYLSREVKTQLDHVKKLEQDLAHKEEKMVSLKSTKKELYKKVINDGRDTLAAHEQRLQAELARLQERAKQDIDHIRMEATSIADEKVQTFREMKDAARAEAERAQANSRDTQLMHDEILSKYQELQRVSEARDIKAQSEIKMKDFELEQLRAVQQETKFMLSQRSLDNEALKEKVKVLTEKYHTLDMETERGFAGLKTELGVANSCLRSMNEKRQTMEEMSAKPAALLQHELDNARNRRKIYEQRVELQENQVAAAQEHYVDGTGEGTSGSKKRVATNRSGSRRRSSLESTQVQPSQSELEKRKAEESARANDLKEIAEATIRQSKVNENPHTHLRQAIQDTEDQFPHRERSKTDLEYELRQAKTENKHVVARLHNLQRDLKHILQARGTMENFQKLLQGKGIHISDEVIKRITSSRSQHAH